ncbi:MAG TPA: monovalent cation/H+ antiporter subunit D family protein [Firmicutes bacterium]|nr:monovalent cation/H+ antiporter subunit D family protein [Bacillota bacterium]
MNLLPVLTVFTPLVFTFVVLLCCRKNGFALRALSLAATLLTFLFTLLMIPALVSGRTLGADVRFFAFPFSVSFQADSLSIFFAVIFAGSFLAAMVYSFGYLAHSHARLRYYTLLLVCECAILGVVLTATLVGLFLFFELMAVSSYVLIIHEEDEDAMFAGSKYLFMTIIAGLAVFFGLALTYYLSGRIDYLAGGYIGASPLAKLALFAFLLGFGVKAGMFPLHIWLPDAHPAAPAAFSALLSGCMIKTGAYGLIRVFYFLYTPEAVQAAGADRALLWLAVITMLLGSAMALRQDNLKRRLAYSSIAQIGYILLGISLGSEHALFGALIHVFAHAVMKGTLFLCAGAIIIQTGKKQISELYGIGLQMPVTMAAFALASLSMVGIPPFNGFFSKWHLAVASLETGHGVLVAVLIASSLLNALYYFPVVINAFFPREEKTAAGKKQWLRDEVPRGMLYATTVLAVCCVVFAFTRPHWPLYFARQIAAGIF